MNRISIKKIPYIYILYYKLSEMKFTYHLHYYNKYVMNFFEIRYMDTIIYANLNLTL